MTIQSIWTEEIRVRAHEADFRTQWKPAAFFQAMQEAASHHASHFGYHYLEMLKHDQIWILSRVKIYFHEFPIIGEKVILRTWPKGIQQKIFFMRDFEIEGEDGRRLATATSAWILVNPKIRRMLLSQSLYGSIPDNDGLSALDESLEKINPSGGSTERLRVKAGYSAVDMMHHVNNARYIEWISDCFTLEEYQAKRIEWLQINYVNEVKPNEALSLKVGPDSNDPELCVVEGINLVNGLRAFEAAVKWTDLSSKLPPI
jgi:medium-chain acyl-[acyl-carrier-protein] hydrolase